MTAVEFFPARLTSGELEELRRAVQLIETASLASRLTRALGDRVEAMGRVLPQRARRMVAAATESALKVALGVAVRSLKTRATNLPREVKSADRLHKAAAAASGAIGGAFGLGALAVELPISTTILLRSIAEIARSEGEDLSRPAARLACLEVFALQGHQAAETGLESGYFAARAALAQSVSESARFLTRSGFGAEAAPVVVRMISQIAARFGVAVSQKLAAQAVPIVGAVGGAAINAAFAEHFQTLARGHFIVRRLERRYGTDLVQGEYQRLRRMG